MARAVKAAKCPGGAASDAGRKIEKVVRFGAFWCVTCATGFGGALHVVVWAQLWRCIGRSDRKNSKSDAI